MTAGAYTRKEQAERIVWSEIHSILVANSGLIRDRLHRSVEMPSSRRLLTLAFDKAISETFERGDKDFTR